MYYCYQWKNKQNVYKILKGLYTLIAIISIKCISFTLKYSTDALFWLSLPKYKIYLKICSSVLYSRSISLNYLCPDCSFPISMLADLNFTLLCSYEFRWSIFSPFLILYKHLENTVEIISESWHYDFLDSFTFWTCFPENTSICYH